MTEKLDLDALAAKYGYSSPKEEPKKDLWVDFDSLRSRLSDRFEQVFLEPLREKVGGPFLVEKVDGGRLTFRASLYSVETECIELRMSWMVRDEFEGDSAIAGANFTNVGESTWDNIHRFVEPRFRGQGICRLFFDLATVAAETRAFQTGEVHQFTAAPYQLDVLNAFLAMGFSLAESEKLDPIVKGPGKGVSVGNFWSGSCHDGARPWSAMQHGVPYRIPVVKRV